MQHREKSDAEISPAETMFCSNLTSRAIGRSYDIYVLGEHRHLILHIDSNVSLRKSFSRRSLYPELEAMTCTTPCLGEPLRDHSVTLYE